MNDSLPNQGYQASLVQPSAMKSLIRHYLPSKLSES
jgi:hypothetical protein